MKAEGSGKREIKFSKIQPLINKEMYCLGTSALDSEKPGFESRLRDFGQTT